MLDRIRAETAPTMKLFVVDDLRKKILKNLLHFLSGLIREKGTFSLLVKKKKIHIYHVLVLLTESIYC